MLFPTSLVGSYPQPDWLIDRKRLGDRFPPRVRARELWRVDPAYLAEAQRDATLLAIRAQEQAGLDIVTDGEICRESYSNRFATALDGVDIIAPPSGQKFISVDATTGLAAVRTPGQVLYLAYGNAANATSGGFFPAGVNGTINSSSTSA